MNRDISKALYVITCFSLVLVNWSTIQAQDVRADLVLLNGKIVTMDDQAPQVQALAILDGAIKDRGTTERIKHYIGPSTEVIELQGKLAIPGFIDAHAHFISLGRSKMILNLQDTSNWEEIVALVGRTIKNSAPGEWILGRGWHQEKWNKPVDPQVEGYPTHHSLSSISADNPIILTHASGHMCLANSRAMALAGVTNATPNPEGGELLRDEQGGLTGIFRETAQDLVKNTYDKVQSKRTAAELRAEKLKAIELATEECLRSGVTSFHDAGTSFEDIDLFKKLAAAGKLKLRLWVMINESFEELVRRIKDYRIIGFGDHHLTVRSIKRFMDGALGAHGAWLLQPYSDLTESTGLQLMSLAELRQVGQLALKHGFQVCVHAIGDRANREVLNVYEEVMKGSDRSDQFRWRIEHAQHLHPDDIPRFAKIGIIASMQGCHATSDAPFVVTRLGQKRASEGAYVWNTLVRSGAIVVNGTDAPVESVNPLANYYALVTRKTKNGLSFFPEQRLTRAEALRVSTLYPAFAAFEEDILGSLSIGKLADVVVLSHDILEVPEEVIPQTKVLYTIIGGEIVYRHEIH